MNNYIDKIYYEIIECEQKWNSEITEIIMNNNTKTFLTQKINAEKPMCTSIIREIKSIFGLKIVENDNLKDGEFIIPLQHFESADGCGFVDIYEKVYKFKID